uniref:1-acyl-sn-glycerol-3-phosphate acyltransferase delta n=1 Tax=Leptobrachium leishanense TaxID=445787 RepID=A0A8C5PN57_9ANUR
MPSRGYQRLREFSDLCMELRVAKAEGDLPGLSYLDSARGIHSLAQKLPYELHERWITHGCNYKRDHNVPFPPFSEFVDFVDRQARMKDDPSFIFPVSYSTSFGPKQPRAPVAVHKTNISSQRFTESQLEDRDSDPTKFCPLHKMPHPLQKCRAFRTKTIQERKAFLKENNICFKCCSSSTHFAKDCKSSKVLAKKELSYVPVIGWMWYFLEIVFCKRKWEEDRNTVIQGLHNLRDYPEHFWFLIHCEGTRFTEKKHIISMQVAEAKGLPKLKHHLLPRTKGFAITVQSLRNVVSAVYDSTLNFRNNENPTLLGVLNGKKYHADLYVRRIPLEEIPEDEKECASWLHKLYQEKDAFQEEYYKAGVYPGTAIVPPRRPWSLLNWLFWASILSFPLFKYVASMISSGSYLTLAIFALLMVIVSMVVRKMIGVTEIGRGSTYGNNENKRKQA